MTELFDTTLKRYPDGLAVLDGETAMSYRDLDVASNSLAWRLQARGITLEDRVGVYLERSSDLYVALVGILKAGGAYVAVDTRYPAARRDYMLINSGAKVIVTDSPQAAQLQHLDIDVVTITGAEGDPDLVEIAPATAASVLYTSGSAGEPKALVLEHRNLVSFATNPSLPRLRAGERVGQISSVSFDAFHFEIWTAFADGACSVILPPVPELLAVGFQQQMRRHGIVAMLVPTMVVNHLVRADADAFAPLRILQVGGDVILPSVCRDLLSGEFRGEMFNLYGPTEITAACTAHQITAADAEREAIPIGRPISGVTVHVLDAGLSPVPPGEVGEIFVGGPGVARGYQDRPELTAERFLILDHLGDAGCRYYRTGDLARRRTNGVLEFAGRADRQVKIRGYRVEPDEVEQTEADLHLRGGHPRALAWLCRDRVALPADLLVPLRKCPGNASIPGHYGVTVRRCIGAFVAQAETSPPVDSLLAAGVRLHTDDDALRPGSSALPTSLCVSRPPQQPQKAASR